jgi:hypothetical protein
MSSTSKSRSHSPSFEASMKDIYSNRVDNKAIEFYFLLLQVTRVLFNEKMYPPIDFLMLHHLSNQHL